MIVVGFVGAGARYPEWFSEGIKAGTFKERNDQAVQSELLRTRHADVIVSDSYIFYFYASIIKKTNNMKEDLMVDEQSFTNEDPQDYRPVFRDKKIRDDFNSGLEYVRLKKLDKIIYNKYLK